jgi:5-methylcytosine-specific restriction endonuclease McrA
MPLLFPKPQKKQKPGNLKKELDDLVSKIVRTREKECMTCRSKFKLGCSHWIPRAHLGVSWDLRNCHTQCNVCNDQHSNLAHKGILRPYSQFMWLRYGDKVMAELFDIRDEPIKQHRMQEILEEMKELAKNMGIL